MHFQWQLDVQLAEIIIGQSCRIDLAGGDADHQPVVARGQVRDAFLVFNHLEFREQLAELSFLARTDQKLVLLVPSKSAKKMFTVFFIDVNFFQLITIECVCTVSRRQKKHPVIIRAEVEHLVLDQSIFGRILCSRERNTVLQTFFKKVSFLLGIYRTNDQQKTNGI